MPSPLDAVTSKLTLSEESDHYRVLYGPRDRQFDSSALGIEGVRTPILIARYIENLERLYAAMTSIVFGRQHLNQKVTVYVCKIPLLIYRGDPFTAQTKNGPPMIGLPCRSMEPSKQSAFGRAAAEAVHEATHVFNFVSRPPNRSHIEKDWRWFDEATAVFMERFVLPGNPEGVRFAANWVDRPEAPLDDPDSEYEASMFVSYLVNRLGPAIITRMWTQSIPSERPFDALYRLLPRTALTKDVLPIFGEYAVDSYFLWDHRSPGFALDVYYRFGHRATADTVHLQSGDAMNLETRLDHLACCYFRLSVSDSVHAIRVELSAASPTHALSAELVVITRRQHRGLQVALAPEPNGNLAGNAGPLDIRDLDHLVLVLANCGIGSAHDGKVCRVRISAT